MPRVSFLLTLAVISVGIPAHAQQATSSPLDVVYVIENFNQLQAYDVDPKTGIPTAAGSAITISKEGSYVIPSPDDHFVYILAWDTANNEQLRVFATDDNGSLQQPPVQVMNVSNVDPFEIDPNGKFAYAVKETDNDQGTVATIWEASVDSETGLIGKLTRVVGPSAPNGPCGTGWSVNGTLRFDGFNTSGSKFYYDWYCTTHDSISAGYFARDVDAETGMLGPKKEVFQWGEDDSADGVWFTPRALIDYADPAGVIGAGSVTVYPPSGGSKPLISCYATMLQACSSGWGAVVDPAGVFMFLQAEPDDAIVAVIDLTSRRLVATGNHIPQMVQQISPDRLLLYTTSLGYVTIYVFDSNTGGVQAGGTIQVPFQYSLVSAVRK